MGTWGTGYFEDDTALDFVDEIEESKDPKKIISTVLRAAAESAYLEAPDGTAAIICSIYVDSQVNGTKFSSDTYFAEVDNFTTKYTSVDLSDQNVNAVIALQKIISDNSELNELWTDTGEDYFQWKKGIEVLIEHLAK